jgi:hypothetical protein
LGCARVDQPPAPPGVVSSLLAQYPAPASCVYSGDHGRIVESLAVDRDGTIYFIDNCWGALFRIGPDRTVTQLTGYAQNAVVDVGGPGESTRLASPYGLALDAHGDPIILDGSTIVQYVSSQHQFVPIGWSAHVGYADGRVGDGPTAAVWNVQLFGLAIDRDQNLFYFCDTWNNVIRRFDPATHEVVTIAGVAVDGLEAGGYADGPGNVAQFSAPGALMLDANGDLVVADDANSAIRRISLHDPAHTVTTIAGGHPHVWGYAEGRGSAVVMNAPQGLALGRDGSIIFADTLNLVIRSITADGATHLVAGIPAAGAGDVPENPGIDGRGGVATFAFPVRIGAASDGAIYVADWFGIREVRY